jgi:hypothetical protein
MCQKTESDQVKPPRTPHPQTGRKSLLEVNPQITEAMASLIRSGVPISHAAAKCGVAYNTVCAWIDRAEPRDGDGISDAKRELYAHFKDTIQRARAEKVDALLRSIADAGNKRSKVTGQRDWKAHAWILEKTEQQDFGHRAKIEADVNVNDSARDEIARMLARLATASGASEVAQIVEPGSDEDT